MKNATPPAERLLNLVIALINTTKPLTRREIQKIVVGYDLSADDKAFERMFERDKDLLRDLGVPIVVVDSELSHATEQGYRIDKDQYSLGELHLDPAEIGLLSLATRIWQDTSLEAETQRGLTKLKPNALSEDNRVFAGFAPRLGHDSSELETVLDATTARQRIQFEYRSGNATTLTARTLEPWSVLARGSGWYVIGQDTDKKERRLFKLSRIVGKVKKVGQIGAYEVPDDIDFAQILDPLSSPIQHAQLAVRTGRAPVLRVRSTVDTFPVPPAFEAHSVEFRDLVEFADELAGLGPDVVVISPENLRTEVINRLRSTMSIPAGGEK